MVSTVLLSFTASMAQVWAALMVFQILLVREGVTRHHEVIEQQWKIARKWWGPLIARLAGRDAGIKERLARYELSDDVISTAFTDRTSFVQLIKAIRQHQILVSEGLSPGTLNGFELSPLDWQKVFDPIAQKVAAADQVRSNPLSAFTIGCMGIGGNISGLLLLPLFHRSEHSLWIIMAFLVAGNLFLAFRFIREIYAALS